MTTRKRRLFKPRLVRSIATALNVTYTAARQASNDEIECSDHRKDCPIHRDRWLHWRGVIP